MYALIAEAYAHSLYLKQNDMTVKQLIDRLSLIPEEERNMEVIVRKESDFDDNQDILEVAIYDDDDDEPEDFVTILIEQ